MASNKPRLTWRGPQVQRDARRRVADGMKRFIEDAAYVAQGLAPVDTGELQASTGAKADLSTLTFTLYADAPHAGFVIFGTRNMPARDYLTETFEIMQREFDTYFNDAR